MSESRRDKPCMAESMSQVGLVEYSLGKGLRHPGKSLLTHFPRTGRGKDAFLEEEEHL